LRSVGGDAERGHAGGNAYILGIQSRTPVSSGTSRQRHLGLDEMRGTLDFDWQMERIRERYEIRTVNCIVS